MTKKEKKISSLRHRIKTAQEIIEKNTELLKKLKSELDVAEMDELKTVLQLNGMTFDEVIKNISNKTEKIIIEKKVEPEIKNITLEDKKNV